MQLADITTQFRSELIADTYSRWLKPHSRVLDIGCGNGRVSLFLVNKFNLNLTGCDVDKYLSEPIKFVRMTRANKLPFAGKVFDAALFNDVLHHINYSDQELLLTEAVRASKQVLIFELKPTFLTRNLDWLLNRIHHKEMAIPFTYHTSREWELIFKWNGWKWQKIEVRSPRFYPFQHVAYRIY